MKKSQNTISSDNKGRKWGRGILPKNSVKPKVFPRNMYPKVSPQRQKKRRISKYLDEKVNIRGVKK